jgi:hypothetical protein
MSKYWLFALVALTSLACRGSKASITAAEIDCPASEISIGERSTDRGTDSKSASWTAECRGNHYFCTRTVHKDGRDQFSCVEQTDASPFYADTHKPGKKKPADSSRAGDSTKKAIAPFVSVAGFQFASDVEATRAVCEGAGHTWNQTKEKLATCSGTGDDVGFPAYASLTFCEGKLCGVTLRHRPESSWLSSMVEIKRTLVGKYGAPGDSGAMIPSECHTESEFIGCLESGRMAPRYAWRWSSGERLRMIVGKPESGKGEIAIRLYYTKPTGSPHVDATGL